MTRKLLFAVFFWGACSNQGQVCTANDAVLGYIEGGKHSDVVQPEMRIAQEEIFRPVLSVIRFVNKEDALRIANGTR